MCGGGFSVSRFVGSEIIRMCICWGCVRNMKQGAANNQQQRQQQQQIINHRILRVAEEETKESSSLNERWKVKMNDYTRLNENNRKSISYIFYIPPPSHGWFLTLKSSFGFSFSHHKLFCNVQIPHRTKTCRLNSSEFLEWEKIRGKTFSDIFFLYVSSFACSFIHTQLDYLFNFLPTCQSSSLEFSLAHFVRLTLTWELKEKGMIKSSKICVNLGIFASLFTLIISRRLSYFFLLFFPNSSQLSSSSSHRSVVRKYFSQNQQPSLKAIEPTTTPNASEEFEWKNFDLLVYLEDVSRLSSSMAWQWQCGNVNSFGMRRKRERRCAVMRKKAIYKGFSTLDLSPACCWCLRHEWGESGKRLTLFKVWMMRQGWLGDGWTVEK